MFGFLFDKWLDETFRAKHQIPILKKFYTFPLDFTS